VTLPAGPVTFEVESFAADVSLGSVPVPVYATIHEVRMDQGATSVVLPGGTILPSASVTALREPPR
jgi:flagellar basal-body rod modification protein FlgD